MDTQTEIEKLQQAIVTLEAQRETLGDQTIEVALATLREKVTTLGAVEYGEQRKMVTVLFADLVDSTQLFVRLDPEDVRELTREYFSAWQAAIEMHRGVVEKFIGDAVMAVFGLHSSQEDDPEQAILAALEMRTRLEVLNSMFERERGIRLSMRVGITTGGVLVSTLNERQPSDFVVVGETVNLASRLQNAAPVNGILIAQDTYHLVRGIFVSSQLDPIHVKGVDRPLPVYLVQAAKRQGFRLGTRGVEGIETSLVGREAELKRLQSTFWEVVEKSERQVVSIMGEAGIGKSRLIYEFDNWLELLPDEVFYFKGRANPSTRNTPYSLIRNMFAYRFDIHDSDAPPVVRQKLESGLSETLGGNEGGIRQANYIGRLLGFELGPGLGQPESGQAIKQFHEQALVFLKDYFRGLAQQHPVVVLLEDIHWADDSSLDLLYRLEGSLGRQPIFIVCTARPQLFDRRPHWGEGLTFHYRLNLRPLSSRESSQLVDEILQKVEVVPEALRTAVLHKAEGNPFYIEESVRMLVDEGVIEKTADRWQVNLDHLTQVKIPPTLAGVLQARLDSLDPLERLMLQRAAVIGRVFWDQAVAYLSEEEAAEPAEARSAAQVTLGELRGREIIAQRERSSFQATYEYLFKHSLFRDVTYDSLLKSSRRMYHARAARWLEEVTTQIGRAEEYAALIAWHNEQAGNHALAVGWYQRAGIHAAARYANDEAVHAFSRAIELTTQGDISKEYELTLAREQVYDRLGARQNQAEDLEKLAQWADLHSDTAAQAEIALRKANFAFQTGDYPAAMAAAQQAVTLGKRAGLIDKEAEGYYVWARAIDFQRAQPEAMAKFEQALALARSAGLSQLEANILLGIGPHYSDLNEYAEARKHIQAAAKIFHDLNDRSGEGRALGNLGVTAWGEGNLADAKNNFEAALKVMQEIGDRRIEGILVGNLGVIAYDQFNHTEAQRYHTQALEISREVQDRYSECINLGNLAEVSRDLGGFEQAQALSVESLEIAREIGSALHQSAVLQGWSLLMEYLGDLTAGMEKAQQAVALAREAQSARYESGGLNRVGQILLLTGHPEEAAGYLRKAYEMGKELGLESRAAESLAGLALALVALGDLPGAMNGIESILQHLETQTLSGTDEPARVYLSCYEVLKISGDPRAEAVLAAGNRFLQERAALIEDESQRFTFLNRIPGNRQLLAYWANLQAR